MKITLIEKGLNAIIYPFNTLNIIFTQLNFLDFQLFCELSLYLSNFRCDSFGNRPVTATSSQNRKTGPGGRVRSGSTGNRPQTAINRSNHIQQQSQPQQNSQPNSQQV